MDAAIADRRKKIALVILISATVLFLASLLPTGAMIIFSPMAFDSGPKPGTWAFVITLFAYPVVVLVRLAAAWICFAKRALSARDVVVRAADHPSHRALRAGDLVLVNGARGDARHRRKGRSGSHLNF
jgi:hypothetical protein